MNLLDNPLSMRRRTFLRAGVGALGASAVAGTILSGCSTKPTEQLGPVVDIGTGSLQGHVVDSVHRFLGVPYAEPPTGQGRFRRPVVRSSWTGTFNASGYGATPAPSRLTQSQAQSEALEVDTDCLNLNVWSADLGAANLPVMVWVHGHGEMGGPGANPSLSGEEFAKDGVVLVTCNRRTGAEADLYLEPLMGQGVGPGNLGVLDQIAALKWVQDNIVKFGGNPNNVTLFGHADGAAICQAVVAAPESRGLLHRVILQSGMFSAQRQHTASAIAQHMLDSLGVKAGDLDALLAQPWQAFAEQYENISALGLGYPQPYLPLINETVPAHPADVGHAGFGKHLDYLVGSCSDEVLLQAPDFADAHSRWQAERAEQVLSSGPVGRDELAQVYRAQWPELDDQAIEGRLVGDLITRVPTMRLAQGLALTRSARTYVYLFDAPASGLGSVHGFNRLLFGSDDSAVTAAENAGSSVVANYMRTAWTNFARSGDPSTHSVNWPAYTPESRKVLRIDQSPHAMKDAFDSQRQVLGKVMTDSWYDLGL